MRTTVNAPGKQKISASISLGRLFIVVSAICLITLGGVPQSVLAGATKTTTTETFTDDGSDASVAVTDHLMATVTTAAGQGGNNAMTDAVVSIGGTVAAADVQDVSVFYGGAEMARVTSPGSLSNISLTGFTTPDSGGLDFTFYVSLKSSADGKTFNLTVESISPVTADNVPLPQTTATYNATAAVGCNTVNPTITLSAGQSIGASGTASYTITLTNNDNGGCAATDFTVAVASGGDTGNTASFVTPSVTNPASCVINLAETLTDNTSCTLEVTADAAPTDTDVMNTVIEVTSGSHTTQTANVDTTIALAAGFGCSDCHGNPPLDGAVRDPATGAFIGDHGPHVTTASMACNACHIDSSGYTNKHRNGNIEMLATIQGGSYSKGTSFPEVTNPTTGTCNTTDCHGSSNPQWGVTAGNGCTLCHNNGTTDGAAANAWPSTTFRVADAVGAHATHINQPYGYISSMTAAQMCDECHGTYASSGDTGHLETPADDADVPLAGPTATAGGEPAGGYTNGAQTCAVYCHGANMASNGDTTDDGLTPAWSGTNLDGSTFNTDCAFCHGFPPKGYGGSHESMTTGDGSGCSACHTHLNDGTDANESGWSGGVFNDVSLHINGSVDAAGGCNGCHDSGSGGAPIVTASSSHVDADGTGNSYTAGTCTDCHGGHADGATGVNDVEISTDVPIFTAGSYSTHAGGAIQLGGGATTGYAKSTEAELCWSCHDTNGISEWGKTWGASYLTGTVSTSDWTTANWSSGVAAFSYKNGNIGTLGSVHGTAGMDTKSADGMTYKTGETPADISCTYCHDVHMVKKTVGNYDPVGVPYLRGNWTSNVFPNDGAPQPAHDGTWGAGDARGSVPRAAALLNTAGNNEEGGWQIEQNNGRNDSGQSYATFGGLCNNCHTETGVVSGWGPHESVVAGFAGGNENDIFDNSIHGGSGTWQHGYIVNAGTTDARGQAAGKTAYIGALRNSNQWSDGISPPAGKPQYTPLMQPSFTAGAVTSLTTSGNVAQANFHNFMCSKCHQPHASRLPRLMITNCLDVNHNQWDSGYVPNGWQSFTAGELAYSPTAGNCHRYVDGGDGNGENGLEAGWNLVTPWDDGTGLPFN